MGRSFLDNGRKKEEGKSNRSFLDTGEMVKTTTTVQANTNTVERSKPAATISLYRENLSKRGLPASAVVQKETGVKTPNNALDRVKLAAAGAAKQSIGSYGAGIGVVPALSDKWRNDAGMRSSNDIAAELEEEYKTATGLRKMQLAQDIKRFREMGSMEGGGRSLIDKGGKLADSGSTDILSAKQGLGSLGKFAVDVGVGAGQMGIDAVAGALTGGNMLSAMALRSLGGGTHEALQHGASLESAAAYGGLSAAVEVGTEKLFSIAAPLKKMAGKGLGDEAIEKLASRASFDFIKSKEGRDLAQMIMRTGLSATSEGAEEIISGVVNPILKNATYSSGETVDLKEAFYEGLVGAATGGLFGGAGEINTYRNGRRLNNLSNGSDITGELVFNGRNSSNQATSRLADRVAADYAEEGSATNYQLGRLQRAVSEDIRNNNIEVGQRDFSVDTLMQRLTGAQVEESAARKAAQALNSVFTGKPISNSMAESIINVPQAANIYNEMSLRSIPEGTMSEKRKAIKSYAESHSTLPSEAQNADSRIVNNQTEKIAENGIQELVAQDSGNIIARQTPRNAGRSAQMFRETPIMTAVRNEIRNYGDNGAKAFSSAFTAANNSDPVRFQSNFNGWAKGFSSYYNAGRAALPFDRVRATNSVYDGFITEEAARNAYLAGGNDRAASLTERKNNVASEKEKSGRFTDNSHGAISGKTRRVLKALAEKTGTNIVIEAQLESNGYYQDGEIHIGADAAMDITKVARHEITHALKESSPELYDALEEHVINEMTAEGFYNELEGKIKGYSESGVELTNEAAIEELVSEYAEELFTNEDAFARLVGADRTLAERLLDLLKDFIAKIRGTVSSADIRVLTDAQKMWIDMLNGAQSVKRSSTEAKQSIEYDADNKPFVIIDEDILNGVAKDDWVKTVKDTLAKKFPNGVSVAGRNIKINDKSRREMTFSKYAQWLARHDRQLYADRFKAFNNADEIILASREYINEGIKHARKDNIRDFARGKISIRVGNNDYQADVIVGTASTNTMLLYDVINMKKTVIKEKTDKSYGLKEDHRRDLSASDNSILNTNTKSNKKFSLKEPVEESGSLVALHNFSESNALKAIKLGGLPMPSIAITRSDIPHTNFGDITLVMNKDAIDPQADRRNTVYSADAWTPTFPPIEYKAREKVTDRIRAKYYELSKNIGENARPLYNYAYDAERKLASSGGEQGVIEDLKDDTAMMRVYLFDSKNEKIEDITKEIRTGMSEIQRARAEFFAKEMGDTIKEYSKLEPENTSTYIREHSDYARNTYYKFLVEHGFSEEKSKSMVEKKNNIEIWSFIEEATDYMNGNTEEVHQEIDSQATEKAIRDAVDQSEYEAWLKDMFSGIEEKTGIYNNKDIYTKSGNRLSFEQLHYPVTLENIARAMSEQNGGDSRNVSGFYGVKSLRAGTARRFSSIKDMHDNEGRLKHLSKEEADEINNTLSERLSKLITEISEKTGRSESFNEMDIVGNILMEVSEQKKITVDSVVRVFEENNRKIGNGLAAEIRDLLFDISEMPVNIFEAKPERAVMFDEVLAAIVPDNASSELKDGFRDVGVEVVTYEAGNNDSRLEKVNSIPNAKFSQKKQSDVEKSYKRLARENDILREQLDKARREVRRSDRAELDKKKTEEYVKGMIAEYSSTMDRGELTDKLLAIYRDMGTSEADYSEIKARATLLADEVVSSAAMLDTGMYDEYKELINTIRNTPITLADADRKELAYYEGSYNDFRKANIGSIKLVNDANLSVDEFYAGLCEEYPEMFDASVANPAEQLLAIRDVLDSLKPTFENPYGDFYDEAVEMLSLDILETFFDIPQARKTFADRAADKLEHQKIKDAAKMQKLREQKDEKIAKIKEESKKRKDEALSKVRADRDKKLRETKDYYINMNKERKSKADRRVRINQIKTITKSMVRTLENPTDNKHVPEGLRKSVAAFFSALDFETDRQGLRTKQALKDLRSELRDIADGIREGEAEMFVNIDADLDNMLKSIADRMGMAPISKMSDSEVEDLYQACRAVKFIVSTANKRFTEGRQQSVTETSEALISDLKAKKDKKDARNSATEMFDRHINMQTVNPLDFFDMLGNTGKEIYKDLRRAMNKKTEALASTISKMQELTDGTDAAKWGENKKSYETSGGRTIELNDTQVMSLYLLNKREQAKAHIYEGGIKVNDRSYAPVNVTMEDVARITSTMTTEQKKVADGISEILNTDSTNLINEASMQVFGYMKAREQNYFPIESDNDFLASALGTVPADPSIKNKGQFKATVKGANNPLVLNDIFDVFAKTMDNATTYNAYLGIFSDMQKIFNYKSENGVMKQLITQKLGRSGNEYIQKLVVDLNGGMGGRSATPIVDKLLRNYKAARIGWNLSVMVQQPTAITRAYAMIDAKYIAKGVAKKGDYDKVKKYSPIAKWKDWGFFTNNTGRELKSLCLNKSGWTDKFFAPIGAMDNLAWGKLWNAVEYEIRDKRPELQAGSEEFYAACSERFENIIDRTQVVDSTLHRSHIMRSEDKFAKVYTSFMSEPLKNYNLVRSALIKAKTEGTREAKVEAARAVASFVMSNLTATFMASLVATLRNKARDDDDKGWLELFAETFTGRFIENTFAVEPLSNTIIQMIGGQGTDRMELAGAADFVAAIKRFGQNLTAFAKGEEEPFTWTKVNKDIVAAAGKCTGIPTATLIRDFEAFLDTTFDMTDWYEGQYAKAKMLNNIGLTENRGKFVKIFYEALSSGDTDAATTIYNDMLVNGISKDYIEKHYAALTRKALENEVEDMRGLIAEWNALPEEERTPELKDEYQSKLDERYAEVAAMGYSDKDINKALKKKSSSSDKSGKYLVGKAYKAYSEYQDNPTGANKEKFLEWYYPLLDAGYDDEDILAAFAAMEE